MEIKLDRLKQPKDLTSLSKIIETRLNETEQFNINMEDVDHVSLANFNALLNLHMKLRRMGKILTYTNCNSDRIKALIHKTQLSNVFIIE